MDVLNDEWFNVLGASKNSTALVELLQSKGADLEKSEQKVFKDTTLYNLYDRGLSFAFVDGKLDSIDFYQKDKKFKSVEDMLLPFGISKSTTGKDLVDKFGEPEEKGGGLNSKMDIWLRWNYLQVELDEMSWETAKDVTWKSITIFKD